MGKKKRKVQDKPTCWYCERVFDDEKVLIQHQKAKHFKCHICGKRLSTAGGLVIHAFQVHKETISKVPNAKEGRDSVKYEIFGTQGVPTEEDAEGDRKRRKLEDGTSVPGAAPKSPPLTSSGGVSRPANPLPPAVRPPVVPPHPSMPYPWWPPGPAGYPPRPMPYGGYPPPHPYGMAPPAPYGAPPMPYPPTPVAAPYGAVPPYGAPVPAASPTTAAAPSAAPPSPPSVPMPPPAAAPESPAAVAPTATAQPTVPVAGAAPYPVEHYGPPYQPYVPPPTTEYAAVPGGEMYVPAEAAVGTSAEAAPGTAPPARKTEEMVWMDEASMEERRAEHPRYHYEPEHE